MEMETHVDQVTLVSMRTFQNNNSRTLSTHEKFTSYRCSTSMETDTIEKNSVEKTHGKPVQQEDGERTYETTGLNLCQTSMKKSMRTVMVLT